MYSRGSHPSLRSCHRKFGCVCKQSPTPQRPFGYRKPRITSTRRIFTWEITDVNLHAYASVSAYSTYYYCLHLQYHQAWAHHSHNMATTNPHSPIMLPNTHSRTSSQTSSKSSSSGASYQLILEHMMSYPGTYEIPLRTMYTLNCAPRAQPMPAPLSRSNSRSKTLFTAPSSAGSSPTSPTFPYDQQAATVQFTSALMSQISQLPSQPCSLPPAFVTSFLHRCFTLELHLVDFPQSLTALDYLKDLETRRRKEIVNSLKRLKIDEGFLSSAPGDDELSRWSPSIADWLRSLEAKERKVDALYTQLYIALRRWVCWEPDCNCDNKLNNCRYW